MAIRDDLYTTGSVTLDYLLSNDDGEGTEEHRAWVARQKAKRVFASLRREVEE